MRNILKNTNKRDVTLLFIMLFMCLTSIQQTKADSIPAQPSSRKAIISDIQNDIKQQKKARVQSLKQVKIYESNIRETKLHLAKLGKTIKNSEDQLAQINHSLINLTQRKETLESKIDAQKAQLSSLILAMSRLKRTPAETVLLQQGKPLEIAQSAMVIDNGLKTIRQKTLNLKSLLDELRSTHGALLDKQEKATALQNELSMQFSELSMLLEKREQSFTREKIILSEHTAKINAMAKKAKNLQQLIDNLKEQAPLAQQNGKNNVSYLILPDSALPPHGDYILPISGIIKTSYGVKDRFGALSQGYHIQSYQGALVIAPFAGQIKYAGPFKNHQNVVIIEHKSGYHSLISGLSKLYVHIGQVVMSGEAIGLLGKTQKKTNDQKSEIYYELRKNGKPVNPSILFSDLG